MVSRVLVVMAVPAAGGAGSVDCLAVVRVVRVRVLELVKVLEVESALRCLASLIHAVRYRFDVLDDGGEGEDVLMARLVSILVHILYTFTFLRTNHTCQYGRMTDK